MNKVTVSLSDNVNNDVYNADRMTISDTSILSSVQNEGTFSSSNINIINSFDNTGSVLFTGENTVTLFKNRDSAADLKTQGKTNITTLNNSGVVTTDGENIFGSVVNDGTVNFKSSNVVNTKFTNNSEFNTQGETTIANLENSGNVILGGVNTITDLTNKSTGNVQLNGSDDKITGLLKNEGGTISTKTKTDINSIENSGTISTSDINTIGNIVNTGTISLSGNNTLSGDVTGTGLMEVSDVFVYNASGKTIAKAQSLDFKSGSTSDIQAGTLNIDTNDVWTGRINLNGGNIVYNDITDNGIINAVTGNLSIESGRLILNTTDSKIAEDVITNIAGTVEISNGELNLNNGDSWSGNIDMSAGVFNFKNLNRQNGAFNMTGGTINVLSGDLLIASGSSVAQDSIVKLSSDAFISLTGGNIYINNADELNSLIKAESGNLYVDSRELNQNILSISEDNKSNVNVELTNTTVNMANSTANDNFVLGNLKVDTDSTFALDIDTTSNTNDVVTVGSSAQGTILISSLGSMAKPVPETVTRTYTVLNRMNDSIKIGMFLMIVIYQMVNIKFTIIHLSAKRVLN